MVHRVAGQPVDRHQNTRRAGAVHGFFDVLEATRPRHPVGGSVTEGGPLTDDSDRLEPGLRVELEELHERGSLGGRPGDNHRGPKIAARPAGHEPHIEPVTGDHTDRQRRAHRTQHQAGNNIIHAGLPDDDDHRRHGHALQQPAQPPRPDPADRQSIQPHHPETHNRTPRPQPQPGPHPSPTPRTGTPPPPNTPPNHQPTTNATTSTATNRPRTDHPPPDSSPCAFQRVALSAAPSAALR